jgi:hypothetical protein
MDILSLSVFTIALFVLFPVFVALAGLFAVVRVFMASRMLENSSQDRMLGLHG